MRAIEAGEFGRLPGGLFPKAFLRTYARQVGLDAEKVVAEYLALTAPVEAAARERADSLPGAPGRDLGPGPRGGRQTAPPTSPGNGGNGWIAVIIAGLVIAGVIYWGQRDRGAEGGARSAAAATPPGAAPSRGAARRAVPSSRRGTPVLPPAARNAVPGRAAAVQSAPASSRQLGQALSASGHPLPAVEAQPQRPTGASRIGRLSRSAASPAAVGQIQVAITATAAAWIHLSAAGKTVSQTTLQPGQSVTYALTPPVDLITGNAGGTEVSVNGAPQPALGAAGSIVLWHFPPGTLRVLPPAKPAPPPASPQPGAASAAPKAPPLPAPGASGKALTPAAAAKKSGSGGPATGSVQP